MQDQLRALRLAKGYTQKEVADALGLASASAVTMWESGDRKPPVDKLPAIAELYGCSIDDLFANAKS